MEKMKVAIFSLISISFLSFFIISSPSAEPDLGGGRISLIQGQVLTQTKDGEEWTEASVNFPIMGGDRILTERDGRVEFQFKNGTYVRVGEESQVDIISLYFDRGKEVIHLNQLEGSIYVNHRPTTRADSSFHIDLPYGVLTAYEPSKFRIDLTSSEAKISVSEGSVEFNRDGRPISLVQGRMLILSEKGSTEVAQLYGRDDWDQWNEARDNELVRRRYAQRYLPPELEPWGSEIEGYGQWVYTPEYRYVWVPTVVVGWTPFRLGHWKWSRGIYCWIPYEPWGWVPFHYGRWVHIHHGWVWVPPFPHAAIWHPGAVGWHIGPGDISWVPLAPGEIYYGHRYYGPHSVNITRVNIHNEKNVFINARVKDAVVSVPKDSFFKRSPVKVAQVENPFLNPVKVSGPPTEKPVFLEGKRTPSRPLKEFIENVHLERPNPGERKRDISSTEKTQNDREPRHLSEGPEKPALRDSIRNRSERTGTPKPLQGMGERKDPLPLPMREGTKVERSNSIGEGKERQVPREFILRGDERPRQPNSIKEERLERRQLDTFRTHPLSSNSGERPLVRQSFTKTGLPHVSDSNRQVIPQPHRPGEGVSLSFPMRFFR